MMDGDTRPIPDPTTLTTQQLLREIAWSKEVIETRLAGMDKGIELLQDLANRAPTSPEVAGTVRHLQELHSARFIAVETQFAERDTRAALGESANRAAVSAALQSAKEAVAEQNKSSATAVAKSEAAATKQIDQTIIMITTATASLNDKIDDVKVRLTVIEGHSKGSHEMWGYVVGAIGLAITMATLTVLFTKSFLQ